MRFPSKKPSEPQLGRRRLLGLLGAAPLLVAGCAGDEPTVVLAAGQPLPALELPDLAGRRLRPGGRALLLNFWATWCPPCRAEMGGLDRLYRELHEAGLGIYGISVDDDINLVREFVLQNRIGFPILWDRSAAVTQGRLALRVFPTTVLVGRDGRVAEVVVGERRWDAPPMQDTVRALLA